MVKPHRSEWTDGTDPTGVRITLLHLEGVVIYLQGAKVLGVIGLGVKGVTAGNLGWGYRWLGHYVQLMSSFTLANRWWSVILEDILL